MASDHAPNSSTLPTARRGRWWRGSRCATTGHCFCSFSGTRGPDAGEPCQVKAVLHRAFEGLGWECPQILREMDRAEEISFDRVSQIVMDNWFSGRVVLVGDAACAVSFLAAERAGLAMVQAYVLAGELAPSRTGSPAQRPPIR